MTQSHLDDNFECRQIDNDIMKRLSSAVLNMKLARLRTKDSEKWENRSINKTESSNSYHQSVSEKRNASPTLFRIYCNHYDRYRRINRSYDIR